VITNKNSLFLGFFFFLLFLWKSSQSFRENREIFMPKPLFLFHTFSSPPNTVFQQEFDFTLSFLPPPFPSSLKKEGVFFGWEEVPTNVKSVNLKSIGKNYFF
jgi:hypothetical protein